jgi:GNAT superfamily N-acetyltransferase
LNFDGAWDALPDEGFDWVLEKGFRDRAAGLPSTVASALYIEIAAGYRGRGLSSQMVSMMRQMAKAQGFGQLIAPVRPSLKSRYPLIDIDTYLGWQTPEDLPLDPWLRVHVRLGGKIVRPCRRAMTVSGTRDEWAKWTEIAMPGDGDYVIPYGLVPVQVRGGQGTYVEPGVWVLHQL